MNRRTFHKLTGLTILSPFIFAGKKKQSEHYPPLYRMDDDQPKMGERFMWIMAFEDGSKHMVVGQRTPPTPTSKSYDTWFNENYLLFDVYMIGHFEMKWPDTFKECEEYLTKERLYDILVYKNCPYKKQVKKLDWCNINQITYLSYEIPNSTPFKTEISRNVACTFNMWMPLTDKLPEILPYNRLITISQRKRKYDE